MTGVIIDGAGRRGIRRDAMICCAFAIAIGLVGCDDSARQPPRAVAPSPSTASADWCTKSAVRSQVQSLFGDINAGRVRAAIDLLDATSWHWWRDPLARGQALGYRQVPSHLHDVRHRVGKLTVSSVKLNGVTQEGLDGMGQLQFRIARAGFPPGYAKGAMMCATGKFTVVTIDSW
ncbi:MAG: hypothetical protein ACR2JQ_00095 [Mycobacteriales bacterium]